MSKSLVSYNPRVLVLADAKGRWSSNKHTHSTFPIASEAWTLAFNGDYYFIGDADLKLISNYDIIITNLSITCPHYTKLLDKLVNLCQSRLKHVKWVTSLLDDGTDYLTAESKLKILLDSSDLVNCSNRHIVSLLKAITTTKVELIGYPYPLNNISRLALPIDLQQKKIFICPPLLSRVNEYQVAKQTGLQMEGYEYRYDWNFGNIIQEFKKYYNIVRNEQSPIKKTIANLTNPLKYIDMAKAYYQDSNLIINQHLPPNRFYRAYNNSMIWLDIDNQYSSGRYVLDAAALKIPIITTKSTGYAEELFPYTCLNNEFELDKAIELCHRLIEDESFYKQVSDYPDGKLEHLTAENMKITLLTALNFRL